MDAEPLTPEDTLLLQEIIGIAARDCIRSAGYKCPPNVGSVYDASREVAAHMKRLANVEKKIVAIGIKAGADAAPF